MGHCSNVGHAPTRMGFRAMLIVFCLYDVSFLPLQRTGICASLEQREYIVSKTLFEKEINNRLIHILLHDVARCTESS